MNLKRRDFAIGLVLILFLTVVVVGVFSFPDLPTCTGTCPTETSSSQLPCYEQPFCTSTTGDP